MIRQETNMLRKALLALCLATPLAGCEALMFGNIVASCAARPNPVMLPESLPIAKVGQPYNVPLEVIDISTPVYGIYVSKKFHLPDGLRVEHVDRDSHGLITGTPVKAGTYEVHLSAGTYGTQCAGQTASRVYHLEVAE
ncbi:putative Ig domain-containing protein [Ectopseudomonas hydrolytica]|uniref:putative Ig domain-containing protein n=1 Tax=Ectopseudomonas hydrolytica TaxID=2493633 RepID=UPI003EDF9AFA